MSYRSGRPSKSDWANAFGSSRERIDCIAASRH
jgi:hypothetical protein